MYGYARAYQLTHSWPVWPPGTLLLSLHSASLDPQYMRFSVQAGPVIDAGGLFNYARQGARPGVHCCCAPT